MLKDDGEEESNQYGVNPVLLQMCVYSQRQKECLYLRKK